MVAQDKSGTGMNYKLSEFSGENRGSAVRNAKGWEPLSVGQNSWE